MWYVKNMTSKVQEVIKLTKIVHEYVTRAKLKLLLNFNMTTGK